MEKVHHNNTIVPARRISQLFIDFELLPVIGRPGVVNVIGYAAPLGSGGLHHAKAQPSAAAAAVQDAGDLVLLQRLNENPDLFVFGIYRADNRGIGEALRNELIILPMRQGCKEAADIFAVLSQQTSQRFLIEVAAAAQHPAVLQIDDVFKLKLRQEKQTMGGDPDRCAGKGIFQDFHKIEQCLRVQMALRFVQNDNPFPFPVPLEREKDRHVKQHQLPRRKPFQCLRQRYGCPVNLSYQ